MIESCFSHQKSLQVGFCAASPYIAKSVRVLPILNFPNRIRICLSESFQVGLGSVHPQFESRIEIFPSAFELFHIWLHFISYISYLLSSISILTSIVFFKFLFKFSIIFILYVNIGNCENTICFFFVFVFSLYFRLFNFF